MPCRYGKDGMVMEETVFIQKALVEYLQKNCGWNDKDKVVIFLTEKARKIHWTPDVPEKGLESDLKKMGISYEGVDIKDGISTEQMWSIFETIYSQFEDGDELYIDITHSFRYLPMLLIVLVNYAKLLKNVSVGGIFYGNWEAKDEQNIAPIMDLLPLSLLQDWTIAASDFLQYGQIKKLCQISNASLSGILKDPETRTADNQTLKKFLKTLQVIVNDRLTCRGKDIIDGSDVENLRRYADNIETVAISQLKPVFEKIKDSLSKYGTVNEAVNCIKAARWCLDNCLYQQCITLLDEGVITVLCEACGLDYRSKEDRNIVSKCIKITNNELPEDVWLVDTEEERLKIRTVLEKNQELWSTNGLVREMVNLMELRNDYNHAGFKDNPCQAIRMINRIEDFLKKAEEVL